MRTASRAWNRGPLLREELLTLARDLYYSAPQHDCDSFSTDRRCLTCAVDDGGNCYECGEPDEDAMGMNMCTRCLRTICDDDRDRHYCGNDRTLITYGRSICCK